MSDFLTRLQDRFAQKGWRITVGVRNIAEILNESKCPLSAQEIRALCKQKNTSMDMSTIYRNLARMQEVGVVDEVTQKYIKCTDAPHPGEKRHFLLCEKTGEADEIFLDYFEAIAKQLKREKGFELRRVEMVFHGISKNAL